LFLRINMDGGSQEEITTLKERISKGEAELGKLRARYAELLKARDAYESSLDYHFKQISYYIKKLREYKNNGSNHIQNET